MKSLYILIIHLFLLSTVSLAQLSLNEKGFSFQGIAYDDSGNARTNTSVEVDFSIGTWSESETLITDGFGVFHHVIGENNDGFAKLDFSSNDYSLKVTIGGIEIYNGKFNAVPYARTAGNGVPVGTIMPYVGTTAPVGWLLCDGSSIPSGDQYEQLKSVLGTTWGSTKVPDLRGMFLRGAGGTGGGSLGAKQDDQFESHSHGKGTLSTSSSGAHSHDLWLDLDLADPDDTGGAAEELYVNNGANEDFQEYTESSGAHTHTISGSTASTGGAGETRPVNVSINYIIKY